MIKLNKILNITFLISIMYILTYCRYNNIFFKNYNLNDFADKKWFSGLLIENHQQNTIDLDSCFDEYFDSNNDKQYGLFYNECELWILNSNISKIKFSKYKHLKFSRIRIVNHKIKNLGSLINELKGFDLLELEFFYNNFEGTAFDLYNLEKLKKLRFNNNDNLNLEYSKSIPKHLENLFIENTKLKKLNYDIDSTKYSLLSIENDKIDDFPKNIKELNQLKSLNLIISKEVIKNVNKLDDFLIISLNNNLNKLYLDNFIFINNKIPNIIYNLKGLNQLWLINSNIDFIDEDLLKLNMLNDLDLSYNKLNTFSNVLYNLPNLTSLRLDYNDLDSISFKKYLKFPKK